ncbi:hypothetical protein [Aquamicrobium sp. LC103]|uniref:COG4223 family protein n=1 Tax=Aquamicrobium sp. LC103 TaxID=1120658 RepID=UPI00063E83DA|nr:hypothetical protein [Aquamicrobium sp. LC103]TKT82932.1 hypothetical protein XW59_002920 [Aquamicrobium sp. LC103]
MVKPPRTRHSKTSKEPVTIDLAPGEVSRVKAAAEKADAAKGAAPEQSPGVSTAGPGNAAEKIPAAASSTAKTAAGAAGSASAKPAEKTEGPAKPAEMPGTAGQTSSAKADAAASATTKADAAGSKPFVGRQESAQPSDPERKRGGLGRLAAGLVGGIAALALAAGLQVAGLIPGAGPASDDDDAAIQSLEADIGELRRSLAEIGERQASPDPQLGNRVAGAEERIAALSSEVEKLSSDIAGLGTAPRVQGDTALPVDLGPLEERIASLETGLSNVDRSGAPQEMLSAMDEQVSTLRQEIQTAREAQSAVAGRLDTLESDLAGLTGRVDEQAEKPGTALVISASALKAAIDRGSPFTTELETYATLAPEAPQVAELRNLAAAGVPTRADIAAEAGAAANAMIAAVRPVDPDAGIVDRLWTSAQGLVSVRPVGVVEGGGVPEIAARVEAAVKAEDYARAIQEFESLPDNAKAAGNAFIEKVRARHAADQLVDEAVAAALKG